MSTYTWSVPTGQTITGTTYIKDTDDKIQNTIDDLVDFVNGEGSHSGQGLTYDMVDKTSAQILTNKTITGTFTGNITGNVTGDVTGNADTAAALETARTVELTGDVTGSASFDGTANIAIATSYANSPIPSGCILMWSGSIATIPSGWYLCDGNNGTPNLVDRMVIAAGSTYSVDATGGSKDAIVVSHTHSFSGTTSTAGAHTHTVSYSDGYAGAGTLAGDNATNDGSVSTSEAGDHTHTVSGTTGSTGSSGTDANLPPYYALAYIMKG